MDQRGERSLWTDGVKVLSVVIARRVLLNPGPVTTSDTVKQALVVPDTCPREREFKALIARVAQQLVDVVHGDDRYVALIFEGSGTAAVEACISSVVPQDKGVLVVNNGGYGQRMIEIAQVHQLDVVPYVILWGACLYLAAVESLLQAHRGRISHLAVVHHETTTGMLNPIAECAVLAHRYDAGIIVDAMSLYAGLPIDVGQLELDYPSKCLQTVAGLRSAIATIKPSQQSQHPVESLYAVLDFTSYNDGGGRVGAWRVAE